MRLAAAFLAVLGIAAASVAAEPEALPDDKAHQASLVAQCREMVPANVEISGRIILRNRRGIVQAEYSYALARKNGATTLDIRDANGNAVPFAKEGRILGTDVTWSDLTLDYLWWDDFEADEEKESETVHGQTCSIVLMKNGARTVRVWVDEKTGAMMQAEELMDGRPVRRLWGTRIKKFGERWAPNVLEVETLGSGHRTKITVETLT